jgi:hypothetical protein
MRRGLVTSIALFCVSCSGSNSLAPSDAGAPDATGVGLNGTIPCAVQTVLAQSCQRCHQSPPLFGAPMALETFADLHAGSPPYYQQIHQRIHDGANPMPPPPLARLDAASTAALDAWIAAGAPSDSSACSTSPDDAGTVSDSGGPPPGDDDAGPTPTGCTPDLHIAPTSPYTMTSPETYACYGFDVPNTEKRHVTEIHVRIDNPKIVHHVLLLKSPVSTSGTPIDCNPGPTLNSPMLYAWAPGGLPLVVPAEAGFPQDGTTHYLVQVHYNNAAGSAAPTDGTGFDLCTTANLRKYDADVIAFGSESIAISPHSTGKVSSCFTASSSLDGRRAFAAFPHMHKLGQSITTALKPASGAPVDMGTDTAWSFSNQPWLPIDATIHTGDVIRTDCAWNNSTDLPVTFGQGTADEMCFSFTAYYPITNPALGWAAPAETSGACP